MDNKILGEKLSYFNGKRVITQLLESISSEFMKILEWNTWTCINKTKLNKIDIHHMEKYKCPLDRSKGFSTPVQHWYKETNNMVGYIFS